MKPIEKYIPAAINVVEDLILTEYNQVAPEWDNCICNFGAALRQMGLLTAVTAFSISDDKGAVSKQKLMHYLVRTMFTANNQICSADQDLLSVVKSSTNLRLLKRQVENASVAFKLALRLFIINPKEEEEEDGTTDI